VSKWIFLTVILSAGVANKDRKSFEIDHKTYPVFYIGNGFSWNALIFQDTVVFRRSFSDAGGYLTAGTPVYIWKNLTDSTIYLGRYDLVWITNGGLSKNEDRDRPHPENLYN